MGLPRNVAPRATSADARATDTRGASIDRLPDGCLPGCGVSLRRDELDSLHRDRPRGRRPDRNGGVGRAERFLNLAQAALFIGALTFIFLKGVILS